MKKCYLLNNMNADEFIFAVNEKYGDRLIIYRVNNAQDIIESTESKYVDMFEKELGLYQNVYIGDLVFTKKEILKNHKDIRLYNNVFYDWFIKRILNSENLGLIFRDKEIGMVYIENITNEECESLLEEFDK